ncbi:hypothetical protein LPJ78_001660 [Coemansia sp. RSA 989]|nr:hypothetical protein BX667DRAFT_174560 [Coemansia mojavensis]KAJ1741158.1 hypothetical protein LPJ68_003089 [Coemansia sp. RSA 1086]KAJ1751950.1 hypothetical protein LPJ79_001681 [Coemansia sp. RSA 1821]KAJ1866601.1 hypothetical protein LPJ78_001660 [Coemansia sp. RSA 989]KAJ1871023.1 hypothetical protein LPJ55_004225 [Coemansia sp. RSA 990]KAJ2629123.1 hypothetical protein H4R22_003508 [Coemansia sp. RSA 1290]KAJ2648455.1 hypothetical protein IWW40_003871 [Coemansia sp. RSA 1250]KAJ26703
MATSRIERFMSNLRENLVDGNYYEGHQELRAIAIRLVKQKKHQRAIQLLYLGALELCQYNQWGSVADLTTFMINIYVEEKVPVTDESKERIYDIFERLSQATEYYPRVYEAAIQWTIGAMGSPVGDTQLHHFVGSIMRQKMRFQEAEQHFIVGTPESPLALGNMLFDWAERTGAADYGLFVARGVLKYLALGWYEAACVCWKAFVARMVQDYPNSVVERTGNQALPSKLGTVYYVNDHELVNFVQLLLLTVERADKSPSSASARIYGQLRQQYESRFGVNSSTVHSILDIIAEKYFGVVIQRQQSIMDIVNNLFAPPSRPAVTGATAEDMD